MSNPALLKVIVELRFIDNNPMFNWRSSLFKVITGKTPDKRVNVTDGLQIRIEDRDAFLIIEGNRWAISIEKFKDKEDLLKFIYSLYVKLNSVIQWGKSYRIGFKSVWLTKTDSSFEEFALTLKNKLYKENTFIDSVNDVAGSFLVIQENKTKINYTTGPVTSKEAKGRYQLLKIENELPEVGLLVDIDYYQEEPQVFSTKSFKNFIEGAFVASLKGAEEINQHYL